MTDTAGLIERLRQLVDDQEGGDAVVLVQRQMFNRTVGTLSSQAAEIERLREALGKAEWALVEAAIPLEAILAAGKGSLSMAVWDGVANATAHVRRYMDARAALNGEKE